MWFATYLTCVQRLHLCLMTGRMLLLFPCSKSDCNNYKGMSLLSMPGRMLGRILTERVKEVIMRKSEKYTVVLCQADFRSYRKLLKMQSEWVKRKGKIEQDMLRVYEVLKKKKNLKEQFIREREVIVLLFKGVAEGCAYHNQSFESCFICLCSNGICELF